VGKVNIIRSIEDFMEWVDYVASDYYIFRGQANASWLMRSGAARRIYPDITFTKSDYGLIQGYTRTLIEHSKSRCFNNRNGNQISDLELLAELQHLGAATILLDFTSNPSIALWFACCDCYDSDGLVYYIKNQKNQRGSVNTNQHLENFLKLKPSYKLCPYIWKPNNFNERIHAQSSFFVIAPEPYEFQYERVFISRKIKRQAINLLKTTCQITEESVFPDMAGFAQANSCSSHYVPSLFQKKFNAAMDRLDAKDYESAIDCFNQAIAKAPCHYLGYNNRGLAYAGLGDHAKAIDDYNRAIELYPEYFNPYYNRGNVHLENNEFSLAIEDYTTASNFSHSPEVAYNKLGFVRMKQGEYDKAYDMLNEAKKLAVKDKNTEILKLIEENLEDLLKTSAKPLTNNT
jgi:tetratricopeptide (TPR) repeat protein